MTIRTMPGVRIGGEGGMTGTGPTTTGKDLHQKEEEDAG